MEIAEFAFQVSRSRKPFNGISFGKLNADAVGIRVTEIDVDGVGALCDMRYAEPFAKHIGGDKQAVSRLVSVLVAACRIVECDRRICLLAFADVQAQDIGLRKVDVRADAVFLLVGFQVDYPRFVFVLE